MFLGTRRRRAAVAVSCLAVAVTTAVAGADSRAAAPPRPIVYVNAYGTYAVRPDGTSWRQLNDCTLTPVAGNGRLLVGGFSYVPDREAPLVIMPADRQIDVDCDSGPRTPPVLRYRLRVRSRRDLVEHACLVARRTAHPRRGSLRRGFRVAGPPRGLQRERGRLPRRRPDSRRHLQQRDRCDLVAAWRPDRLRQGLREQRLSGVRRDEDDRGRLRESRAGRDEGERLGRPLALSASADRSVPAGRPPGGWRPFLAAPRCLRRLAGTATGSSSRFTTTATAPSGSPRSARTEPACDTSPEAASCSVLRCRRTAGRSRSSRSPPGKASGLYLLGSAGVLRCAR